MNTKEMRQFLKDNEIDVPRSNVDVIEKYKALNPDFNEEVEATVTEIKKDNIFTYVGSGPTPPSVIKYMGIQSFTRGVSQEVTDPRILAKIGGNRSFVKGEISPDEIIERDEKAKKQVEKIHEEEVKMQIMADRQNRG